MNHRRKIMKIIESFSNITRWNNKINIKNVPLVICEKRDINYISSSNNIIVYEQDNKQYFFKECRKHTKFKNYINIILNDYFENISYCSKANYLKNIIENDLIDKYNLKKFYFLNMYCEQNYDIIKKYTGWDTSAIGLPSLFVLMKSDKLVYSFMYVEFPEFIKYFRNEIDAYHLNYYIKKDCYQTYRSSLSIATKKMADLLSISEMVPDIWYSRLKIGDGPEKFGSVMEKVHGICPLELNMEEKQKITSNFQRQLIIMNLFDIICFQRDHKEENYFVIKNKFGYVDDLCAFDNDSPMTFYPLPIINFDTCIRCSSIVSGFKLNRPYMDKKFAYSVVNLSFDKVKIALKEDLSVLQLFMLKIRLKRLKYILKYFEKKSPERLLDASEWGKKTLIEDISGNYGKTYLKHFLECDENALVYDIMNHKI